MDAKNENMSSWTVERRILLACVISTIVLSPSIVRGFHLPTLSSINADGKRVASLSSDRRAFRRYHVQHQSVVVCNMNNVPNYLAPDFYVKKNATQTNIVIDSTAEDEESVFEEEDQKRGFFRRIKEKLSSTFSSRGADETEGNQKQGYKPNPIDGLRLRFAMAMSGLSNIDILNRRSEWVVACPKTRVGPGQIVPCEVNGLDIIVFASRDGKRLDAFANSCPHLGSPFDLATIERKPATEQGQRIDDGVGDGCVDCIVCPVHRTAFEIQSGDVRGEWCPYPPVLGKVMGFTKPKNKLVKFAVRLKGKNVEVRISTSVRNVERRQEQAEGMSNIQ